MGILWAHLGAIGCIGVSIYYLLYTVLTIFVASPESH